MKKWYAIRTFPGYELKVKENIEKLIKRDSLESSIEEVFIPTYKNYTFVRRVLKLKEELIYPGYIFVKMNLTSELMYTVRGVQYILGYAGINDMKQIPNPIQEEEIAIMQKDSNKVMTSLEEGTEVIYLDGFEEHHVKVKRTNPQERKLTIVYNGEEKETSFDNIQKIK